MTGPDAFVSSMKMETAVTQLGDWLLTQAIHVPFGWVEACVQWLVDEHGGFGACARLSKSDWCQLIYEQWLHSDLRELNCPVLPSLPSGEQDSNCSGTAMKLEGELCLQVVGLFNVSGSYYSQLRSHEGNISVNIPNLDNLEADLGGDPDMTHMTQSASQYNYTQSQGSAFGTRNSFSLVLTDGINQIKVVEWGTLPGSRNSRLLSAGDLSGKLRPGTKVRLRGPLTLRNNVLFVPAGAVETLANPQLQVLGGEVDELLESSDGDLMYQVGLLLAKKLSIPLSEDGSLPSWFPRIRKPAQESDATDGQQQNPISAVTTSQVGPSLSNPCKTVTAQGSGLTLSAVLRPPSTPSLEPWNAEVDEDALITQAAQNLEKQLLTSYTTSNSTASESLAGKNKVTQAAGISRDRAFLGEAEQDVEQEVDPDVFASVMEELENEKLVNLPAVDNQTTAKRTNKVCAQPKRTLSPKIPSASCSSASFEQNRQSRDTKAVRQTVLKLSARKESDGIKRDPPNPVPTPSTSSIRGDESRSSEPDDLLPPAPKRKPWERRRSSVTTELKADNITSPPAADSQTDIQGDQKTDYKFTPFCYIEDMYKELLTVDSGSIVRKRRVYTIRGLLINLLSSLEHHQGSRWTLAARLADGSAVVDVDISSELLTEWIGLTAAESESLRQMSRVNASAPGTNSVAAQEAQKHLLRLKNAITNFRARLSNLSGLFDITSPSATSIGSLSTDSDKPLRPVVVGFRPLSGTWLKELHARVQDRWGLE